jgi:hypothetical protein
MHLLMLAFGLGCVAEAPLEPAQQDSSAVWVPLSEEDLGGGKDSWGDYPECGAEVSLGAACEGDWTTTLCEDSLGQLWWCEGTWKTGK